jgi:hypothetical protein
VGSNFEKGHGSTIKIFRDLIILSVIVVFGFAIDHLTNLFEIFAGLLWRVITGTQIRNGTNGGMRTDPGGGIMPLFDFFEGHEWGCSLEQVSLCLHSGYLRETIRMPEEHLSIRSPT